MNNSSAFVCLLHLTAVGAVGDNCPLTHDTHRNITFSFLLVYFVVGRGWAQ